MRGYLGSTLNGLYGGITMMLSIVLVPLAASAFTSFIARREGRRARLYVALGLVAAAAATSLVGLLPESVTDSRLIAPLALFTLYLAPYTGLHAIDLANVLIFWMPLLGAFAYASAAKRPRPVISAAIGGGLVLVMFAVFLGLVFWSGAPTD